ncbi:hypothetical protein COM08_15475 [Bacillus wiedmannii]|uniref:hypothetical protein n=1 Tax=Bacillus TaxID=1386 RepID=UPI000BF44B37|nr:hypothetical protein [Bacillus wiedmannii]PGC17900.1 hypothetical protein COM08_15475 [Bacillus wiedmannii]
MIDSVISINLSNFVFENQSLKENITIEVNEPQTCFFLERKSHPPEDKKGVYLIFSPGIIDYSNREKGCIYVGEGKIRKRLYRHNYEERFAKDVNYKIIYYLIDEQKDRKAVERILIKYYDPIFNKEGVSKDNQVGNHMVEVKEIQQLASRLKEIFEDVLYIGGKSYDELFNFTTVVVRLLEDGCKLAYIDSEIDRLQNESPSESNAREAIAELCGLNKEELLRQLFGENN